MVSVKNLTVNLNDQNILNNVSCTLEKGRITAFIGKSGAGKTTLLKTMVDIMPINSGAIEVAGEKLSDLNFKKKSETIGYVFQDFNLFVNMTVLQNCIDPLLVHGVSYDDAYTCAVEQLQALEMVDHLSKYPVQLSGGQQQRVALARSLCLRPQIILFDEPTASLDPINTHNLIKILHELKAQGMTIGLSSQDMDFIKKVFDRVYYMKAGKIIEFCDKTELNNTSCLEIQNFIKTS